MILGKSINLFYDTVLTCSVSINCRLPQTPRTPSTAAAHYFDDVFSQAAKRRPSSRRGSTRSEAPTMRRSSTSRSIGAHSTYNTAFTDPEDDPRYQGESDARSEKSGATGATEDAFGKPSNLTGATNGANGANGHHEDADREEADAHVDKYVMDQLSRVKTGDSDTAIYEDEFEAQLDN